MGCLLIVIGLVLMLNSPTSSPFWVLGLIIFIIGLVPDERRN